MVCLCINTIYNEISLDLNMIILWLLTLNSENHIREREPSLSELTYLNENMGILLMKGIVNVGEAWGSWDHVSETSREVGVELDQGVSLSPSRWSLYSDGWLPISDPFQSALPALSYTSGAQSRELFTGAAASTALLCLSAFAFTGLSKECPSLTLFYQANATLSLNPDTGFNSFKENFPSPSNI